MVASAVDGAGGECGEKRDGGPEGGGEWDCGGGIAGGDFVDGHVVEYELSAAAIGEACGCAAGGGEIEGVDGPIERSE